MTRPTHDQVMDRALNESIAEMLKELGDPNIVKKIYPNGWEEASRNARISLHQLCRRSFKVTEDVEQF